MEQELGAWYERAVEGALTALGAENYSDAVDALGAAEEIRGYEQVKIEKAAVARRRTEALLARLQG